MKKQRKPKKTNKTPVQNTSKPLNRNIYLLLLSIIVIIAFARTTSFDFINIDDPKLIFENSLVTDSSVPYSECFRRFIFNVHYKPLVFLSWKLEYQLFGSSASHFHLFNWLLHLANTLLVFFVGLAFFRKLYAKDKLIILSSFALALLFSINPMRVESIAWATERKDVLFSFFFLLSWLSYIRYIKTKQISYVILGGLLYLFSGFSKSMGITLIVVLFLTDLWFNRKIELKLLIEKIPYAIGLLLLMYFYGLINIDWSSATAPEIASNAVEVPNQIISSGAFTGLPAAVQWILSASMRFCLWIIHSIIPVKLTIVYPHAKIFDFFGKALYLFPILVAGMFFWFWNLRKENRFLLGGFLFFGITLSPVLVIDVIGNAVFLSDRYTYIPCLGLFFVLIIFLNKIKKEQIRNLVFLGIAGFYFLGTMFYVGSWENSKALFSHVLKIDPQSALGHLNLGNYHLEKRELDQALGIYNKGLSYNPNYHKLYVNRGRVYLDKGQADLALQDFNKCLAIIPDFSKALVNRGIAFGMKQDLGKALLDFNRVLEVNPNDLEALSNRGIVFHQQGDYQKTIQDYKRYLEIKPMDEDVLNTIGICFNGLGEYDNAIVEFNKALDLNPSNGVFYYNRSISFNKKGDRANALKDALQAQQLGYQVNPSYLDSLR